MTLGVRNPCAECGPGDSDVPENERCPECPYLRYASGFDPNLGVPDAAVKYGASVRLRPQPVDNPVESLLCGCRDGTGDPFCRVCRDDTDDCCVTRAVHDHSTEIPGAASRQTTTELDMLDPVSAFDHPFTD